MLEEATPQLLYSSDNHGYALKRLYDADVLDEDAIVAWGGRAAPGARRAAEPLLAWLAAADSDSEEGAGD